jgi:hypothetical protein
MESRQHKWLRGLASSIAICLVVLLNAPLAFAQDGEQSSGFAEVVKGVVFDPTTYAPAAISYDATMRDWNTSQIFFRNGFVEHNPRFTMTGRPDGRAISYDAGRSLILKDTLRTFAISAAQNATSRIVEQALLERYPEHRTMVKTIGWIQRIAIGSALAYHLSAAHYRQAAVNTRLAREYGYR